MYYPCSENKDADQLRGHREADLRLCFRLCKLLVFSCTGSIVFLIYSFFLELSRKTVRLYGCAAKLWFTYVNIIIYVLCTYSLYMFGICMYEVMNIAKVIMKLKKVLIIKKKKKKVFISLYLLNMAMDQVDTLHVSR